MQALISKEQTIARMRTKGIAGKTRIKNKKGRDKNNMHDYIKMEYMKFWGEMRSERMY